MKKIKVLIIIIFSFHFALFAQTPTKDSIKHNGLTRYYLTYVPAIYNPNKATPLVFNLHGLGSNSSEQMYYGNFIPIADTANFIIVAPDGTSLQGSQFWNVGITPSAVDDIGFLTSLIDTLSLKYNIDKNRIYSTGMSNGGFMSYYLACHSDKFAAIASVTGSITVDEFGKCSPSAPIPVMEIHGIADNTVPYNGSTFVKPIEDVVNYWVGINKCNSVPSITDVPDINTTDGATAKHFLYSGGTNGASVEFFKVINGAHTWPGSAFVIGTTCQDFSACKEIWRFFSSYSKDKLTHTAEYENNKNDLIVYPNPVEQSAVISYQLSANDNVTLSIFDITGRQLKMLVNDVKNIGEYNLEFNTSVLKRGIYFVKLKTDFDSRVIKLVKN